MIEAFLLTMAAATAQGTLNWLAVGTSLKSVVLDESTNSAKYQVLPALLAITLV